MDAATLRDTVETEKASQLDRLGSSKLLIALTDADLTVESVLSAAAHSENAARNTFREWADDESDPAAAAAFAAVADQEADHYERIDTHLPPDFEPADGGPMHVYLRGLDETVPRVAGGLVGRPLVSVKAHTQVVGFFVNEPDRKMADLFRDLKDETADELDRGLALLDDLCRDDEDWERARGAAAYTIQVAYDDYADALAGMGVDPKPIC